MRLQRKTALINGGSSGIEGGSSGIELATARLAPASPAMRPSGLATLCSPVMHLEGRITDRPASRQSARDRWRKATYGPEAAARLYGSACPLRGGRSPEAVGPLS
jgi:hypothetical protein